MYPSDILGLIEQQEITAEQAEKMTVARIDAILDVLWPTRTFKFTESQYADLRRHAFGGMNDMTHRFIPYRLIDLSPIARYL